MSNGGTRKRSYAHPTAEFVRGASRPSSRVMAAQVREQLVRDWIHEPPSGECRQPSRGDRAEAVAQTGDASSNGCGGVGVIAERDSALNDPLESWFFQSEARRVEAIDCVASTIASRFGIGSHVQL